MKAWESSDVSSQNKSLYPKLPSFDASQLNFSPAVPRPRVNTPTRIETSTLPPLNVNLIEFPLDDRCVPTIYKWEEFDPLHDHNNDRISLQNDGFPDSFMNVFDRIYDPIYPNLPADVSISSEYNMEYRTFPILSPPPVSEQSARTNMRQDDLSSCYSVLSGNIVPQNEKNCASNALEQLYPRFSQNITLSREERFLLIDKPEEKALERFTEMVARVRSRKDNELDKNRHETLFNRRVHYNGTDLFVGFLPRMTVEIENCEEPRSDNIFCTECDVNDMIPEVLINAALIYFFDTTNCSDYYLRIRGRLEYLENGRKLSQHHHIIQCCRYERPLKLVLEHKTKVSPQFKRSITDANIPFTVEEATRGNTKQFLSKEELQNLLYLLLEKLNTLEKLTVDVDMSTRITVAVEMISIVAELGKQLETVIPEKLMQLMNDLEETLRMQYQVASNMTNMLNSNIERICQQVIDMVRCYSRLKRAPYTFPFWSKVQSASSQPPRLSEEVKEDFRVRILSLHRYKSHLSQKFLKIHVEVSLYFAGRQLYLQPENFACPWFATMQLVPKIVHKALPPILTANEFIYFKMSGGGKGHNLTINRLPRETLLHVRVWGETDPINSSTGNGIIERELIGWAQFPIFDVDYHLCQGSYWVGLWPKSKSMGDEMACTTNRDSSCPILLVYFEEFEFPCIFPPPDPDLQLNVPFCDFDNLPDNVQAQLLSHIRMGWFLQDSEFIKASLSMGDATSEFELLESTKIQQMSNLLWEHRTHTMDQPMALVSLILLLTYRKPELWTSSQIMSHLYGLMKLWVWPDPVMALRLLCFDVPDIEIRRQARTWLARAPSQDLIIHLPEIIQCVKSDIHLDWSGLGELLLEMSMESMHFANALYWQLKECHVNSCHSLGLQTLFAALLRCCDGLRTTWREQEEVVEKLATTATKVKDVKTKERAAKERALEEGLGHLYDLMKSRGYRERNSALRLPYDLGIGVQQVDVKACGVFSSFTLPLRVVFTNFDQSAATIPVMFKSGDDLRQDRFIANMILLMDRIWLQNGLDLKLIHYRILSTSTTKGLIELVSECCTLRQIQESETSILGAAFDEKCIASWLQKQCGDDTEYLKAVETFLFSSAGCCVATYLLGIGDRHNDNIMLKTTGQMFHIDFSKILGDFQKFAGVNRDRVPFVFTPAMAYVLQSYICPRTKTSGLGMQVFYETCCEAYNILRRHFYHLYTILQLAATSGIPGVDERSIQYFMKALQIRLSEMEATKIFSRDLQKTLSSKFTQINHFIHSLAVGKISSQHENALFRFTPKIHSISMDGKISRVEIERYQSGKHPTGWPVYVFRENSRRSSMIWRSLNDFKELASLLRTKFRLETKLFRVSELIGKCSDAESDAFNTRECLQKIVNILLGMAPEISECDVIYTFFHSSSTSTLEMGRRKSHNEESALTLTSRESMQIKIDMEMSRNKQTLTILVKSANNVYLSSSETPNVYVKCYLQPPLNYPPKQKTQTVQGANPVFNETFVYNFPPGSDFKKHRLCFSIWHYRGVARNEKLVEQCVDLRSLKLGSIESRNLKIENVSTRSTSKRDLTTRTLPPLPGTGWSE